MTKEKFIENLKKARGEYKKYKVEFIQSETFVVDVLANTEEEARKLAERKWKEICENGTEHYHQSCDPQIEQGLIYDVTETEDPFNP